MKKKLFLFLFIFLLLTGCNKVDDTKDFIIDSANKHSIRYLNYFNGYNANNEYKVIIYTQAKEDFNYCFCELLENNKVIYNYTIRNDETSVAGEFIKHNDKTFQILEVDSSVKNEYSMQANEAVINDLLVLEHIDGISIVSYYNETDSSKYDLLKQYAVSYPCFIDLKNGDEVTIYEHLNIFYVDYDNNQNKIINSKPTNYEYPISINGEIKYKLKVKTDFSEPVDFIGVNDQEEMVTAINNSEAFIICGNYIIYKDKETTINVPVIIKKAYSQLKQKVNVQEPYKPLITYTYEDK